MSINGTTTRLEPGTGGDLCTGNYGYGNSDDASMKSSFPSSPLMGDSVTATRETQRELLQGVMDGDQSVNIDFGTINMDYGAHPSLDAATPVSYIEGETTLTSGVTTDGVSSAGDGKGTPANAFVPTTASPENLSTKADEQPGVSAVPGHGGDLGTVDYSTADIADYEIPTLGS